MEICTLGRPLLHLVERTTLIKSRRYNTLIPWVIQINLTILLFVGRQNVLRVKLVLILRMGGLRPIVPLGKIRVNNVKDWKLFLINGKDKRFGLISRTLLLAIKTTLNTNFRMKSRMNIINRILLLQLVRLATLQSFVIRRGRLVELLNIFRLRTLNGITLFRVLVVRLITLDLKLLMKDLGQRNIRREATLFLLKYSQVIRLLVLKKDRKERHLLWWQNKLLNSIRLIGRLRRDIRLFPKVPYWNTLLRIGCGGKNM